MVQIVLLVSLNHYVKRMIFVCQSERFQQFREYWSILALEYLGIGVFWNLKQVEARASIAPPPYLDARLNTVCSHPRVSSCGLGFLSTA